MKNPIFLIIAIIGVALNGFGQSVDNHTNVDAWATKMQNWIVEHPDDKSVLIDLDKFGQEALRKNDSLSMMHFYRLKSHYFHSIQRYQDALKYALMGVQLNHNLNSQLHFQLLLDVVSNYWNLGEHAAAIPYLIQGENRISNPEINEFSKAIFYNFMGQYHYNEYASETALMFFKRGDSLLTLNPDFIELHFIWQQNFKSNIGLCLMDLKRFSEAEANFNLAYSISNSINNKAAMGFALVNKVIASRHTFPDSTFAPILQRALNLVEGDADNNLKLTVLRELAKEYLKYNQADSLRAILPRLETSVEFIPSGKSKVRFLFYLAKFNRFLGESKALDYFDRALALNDSLALNPQGQNLLQLERQRNLNLQEQEAKNLAELKAEQLRKNFRLTSFFLMAAVGFLILLLGVLIALFQKDRRLRKTLKTLRWQNSNSDTLNQQLQLSMQQKNLLLGAVAHDLRNLLVNVNQVSEMMIKRELENNPTFKDRMIKLMERSSRLGMHTIEDLIDGVQPEGRQRLRLEAINPADLIDFITDLLSFKAEKKGITLQINKEPGTVYLYADRDKLNRALINLLDNAIKFSPIDEEVHVGFHSSDEFLIFEITDLGKGLHRSRFTQGEHPFTDIGEAGTLGEPSTGLGLFIVRKIAELHLGSFNLRSEEGKGTTATLLISRNLRA